MGIFRKSKYLRRTERVDCMDVLKQNPIEKSKISRIKKAKLRKTHIKNRKNISIEDIESLLGFNNTKPIILTNADLKDTLEKDDEFKDWYEQELRGIYERIKY